MSRKGTHRSYFLPLVLLSSGLVAQSHRPALLARRTLLVTVDPRLLPSSSSTVAQSTQLLIYVQLFVVDRAWAFSAGRGCEVGRRQGGGGGCCWRWAGGEVDCDEGHPKEAQLSCQSSGLVEATQEGREDGRLFFFAFDLTGILAVCPPAPPVPFDPSTVPDGRFVADGGVAAAGGGGGGAWVNWERRSWLVLSELSMGCVYPIPDQTKASALPNESITEGGTYVLSLVVPSLLGSKHLLFCELVDVERGQVGGRLLGR